MQQPLDNRFLCCSILGCVEVPLRQDVPESVQFLRQLSDAQLQLLVLLLELLGPLLGQHDPPPGLVPALPHRDVVPLPPQSVLRAVLVDEPLVGGSLQGGEEEHGEVLEEQNTEMSVGGGSLGGPSDGGVFTCWVLLWCCCCWVEAAPLRRQEEE